MPNMIQTEPSDLVNLAREINKAHADVKVALLSAVARAAGVGHLLSQAKEMVPHGQWEPWIKKYTAVSPRSARAFMQLERHWAEADPAKRRRVADLGLRGFLKEIAEPRPTPADELGDSIADAVSLSLPGGQTEDPEPAGGIDPEHRRAVMKGIREAEMSSGASRLITGDSIQSLPDLDAINREWDRLDMAGRDKFLSEKLLSHGDPNHRAEIIDVAS